MIRGAFFLFFFFPISFCWFLFFFFFFLVVANVLGVLIECKFVNWRIHTIEWASEDTVVSMYYDFFNLYVSCRPPSCSFFLSILSIKLVSISHILPTVNTICRFHAANFSFAMQLILDMKTWVESKLAELTLEEKVSLLSGVDVWRTAAIPRLGIPQLKVRHLAWEYYIQFIFIWLL